MTLWCIQCAAPFVNIVQSLFATGRWQQCAAGDFCHLATVTECLLANRGYIATEYKFIEVVATTEGPTANALHTVAHSYLFQTTTVVELKIINLIFNIGNHNCSQRLAFAERRCLLAWLGQICNLSTNVQRVYWAILEQFFAQWKFCCSVTDDGIFQLLAALECIVTNRCHGTWYSDVLQPLATLEC